MSKFRFVKKGRIKIVTATPSKATKALKIAKTIKKNFHWELKYHDIFTNETPSNTGVIVPVSELPQGDEPTQRNGAQVRWKSFNFRLLAEIDPAKDADVIRVMVVNDTRTNNAIFNITDLIDPVGSQAMVNHRNNNNKFRFNIYYDKVHRLVSGSANHMVYFQFGKKFNKMQRFSAAAGATASVAGNNLYIVLFSLDNAQLPTVILRSRLSYSDI